MTDQPTNLVLVILYECAKVWMGVLIYYQIFVDFNQVFDTVFQKFIDFVWVCMV